MGGAKKLSPAQAEKRQQDDATKKAGEKKKGKKGQKDDKLAKAGISVILPDEQAMKVIKGAKGITAHELSRQTGVKVSTANAYLTNAMKTGVVKLVAGHSGHHIYQPVAS